MKHYRIAIQQNPTEANWYYRLGDALEDSEDFVGAVAAYQNAVRLNPKYDAAYYNLGNLQMKQKNMVGAHNSYMHCLKIKKTEPDYHFAMGLFYDE